MTFSSALLQFLEAQSDNLTKIDLNRLWLPVLVETILPDEKIRYLVYIVKFKESLPNSFEQLIISNWN
jgi:hypothetical protein